MICRIEDLKNTVSILLTAVDTSELSRITENLELKVENEVLNLSVTNGEYFVNSKIPIYENIDFHATVNAQLFLKLLSKTTTETVEFKVENNSLVVVGNGEYRLPIIYDGDNPLTIPPIDMVNKTTEFEVNSNILNSILKYNSKELNKGVVSNPVQKMYYIDDKGAITFTSGACVNEFTLEKPVKILLNPKVVNLFKLFKDTIVKFELGHNPISDEEVVTVVKFYTNYLTVSAIVNDDDSLVNSVPVSAIRQRAYFEYPYSVSVNRTQLSQAIDRLTLFSYDALKPFCKVEFYSNCMKVYDQTEVNSESVTYNSSSATDIAYSASLNILDVKSILDSYVEQDITINFGDGQAMVIKKPGVYSVVPEAIVS